MSARTDSERIDLLANELHGDKWNDVLPWVVSEEKYIDRATFREVLDRYHARHFAAFAPSVSPDAAEHARNLAAAYPLPPASPAKEEG